MQDGRLQIVDAHLVTGDEVAYSHGFAVLLRQVTVQTRTYSFGTGSVTESLWNASGELILGDSRGPYDVSRPV